MDRLIALWASLDAILPVGDVDVAQCRQMCLRPWTQNEVDDDLVLLGKMDAGAREQPDRAHLYRALAWATYVRYFAAFGEAGRVQECRDLALKEANLWQCHGVVSCRAMTLSDYCRKFVTDFALPLLACSREEQRLRDTALTTRHWGIFPCKDGEIQPLWVGLRPWQPWDRTKLHHGGRMVA